MACFTDLPPEVVLNLLEIMTYGSHATHDLAAFSRVSTTYRNWSERYLYETIEIDDILSSKGLYPLARTFCSRLDLLPHVKILDIRCGQHEYEATRDMEPVFQEGKLDLVKFQSALAGLVHGFTNNDIRTKEMWYEKLNILDTAIPGQTGYCPDVLTAVLISQLPNLHELRFQGPSGKLPKRTWDLLQFVDANPQIEMLNKLQTLSISGSPQYLDNSVELNYRAHWCLGSVKHFIAKNLIQGWYPCRDLREKDCSLETLDLTYGMLDEDEMEQFIRDCSGLKTFRYAYRWDEWDDEKDQFTATDLVAFLVIYHGASLEHLTIDMDQGWNEWPANPMAFVHALSMDKILVDSLLSLVHLKSLTIGQTSLMCTLWRDMVCGIYAEQEASRVRKYSIRQIQDIFPSSLERLTILRHDEKVCWMQQILDDKPKEELVNLTAVFIYMQNGKRGKTTYYRSCGVDYTRYG